MIKAKWIWKKQSDYNKYNDTVIAKKSFTIADLKTARIAVTADTIYRLFINDIWVNDGPCRSYPENFQYDLIDVTGHLKKGKNEIIIIAKYFGCGDFHHKPRHAGILAQLDIDPDTAGARSVCTDKSWKVTTAHGWIPNSPKRSVQMGPYEYYDARLEQKMRFTGASELFTTDNGPWKNLHPRDVALLTKEPVHFQSFISANVTTSDILDFCLPRVRLTHPHLVEANMHINSPMLIAAVINLKKNATVKVTSAGLREPNLNIVIDGKQNKSGIHRLQAGSHLLLASAKALLNHDKEATLRFIDPSEDMTLTNPLDDKHENPFALVRLPQFAFACNDLQWDLETFLQKNPDAREKLNSYKTFAAEMLKTVTDRMTFLEKLGDSAELLAFDEMFVRNPYPAFQHRKVLADASQLVTNPGALIYDNDEYTIVNPIGDGDIELAYDLGHQSVGYYQLELIADQGVHIDINSIEYITGDGKLQHTGENRNSLHYVTKQGVNRFTSLCRRSGRYVFVTIRNLTSSLKIRRLALIESTYPVNHIAALNCSDETLNRIWDISSRTLKLCTEDTFTDCPLYEQTLWVGDARNEALFAYTTFDAVDVGRRCIELAAQSLNHYPITGCQVPSCWDCLLPAWSFLWSVSVWDYYWYTDDKKFLRRVYPAMIKNILGAEKHITHRGLFSCDYWNLFDWADIDDDHQTVLHNSMFLVGAIDSCLKVADALGRKTHTAWLQSLRDNLKKSINACWLESSNSYPDSIHEDDSPSSRTCQHTSFLAILYDIIESKNLKAALDNLLSPPRQMTRVGSPFAILYLYETLEKLTLDDHILESIYKSYTPMLAAGATTVWESFSTGTLAHDDFPTRSHCHGWSAAPLYFLPRIILGIKQTASGARSFTLSPRPNKLTSAAGRIATCKGPLEVNWRIKAKTMHLNYTAPAGTKVRFQSNTQLEQLTIILNGKKLT